MRILRLNIMTIRNSTKNKINQKISEYSNITMIYGGATEQTLQERKEQHIQTDNRFNSMKIKSIHTATSYKMAKEIEEYLIELLDNKFNNNCINDRNNDGTIAQRGGAGIQENHKKYRIYIMFK